MRSLSASIRTPNHKQAKRKPNCADGRRHDVRAGESMLLHHRHVDRKPAKNGRDRAIDKQARTAERATADRLLDGELLAWRQARRRFNAHTFSGRAGSVIGLASEPS